MKGKKKRMIIILCILLCLLTAFICWIIWSNKAVELNTVTIKSDKLPEAFDGFRIAHVSDLHNCNFGIENDKLINILKDAKPDIIAITGDMLDTRRPGLENNLSFAKKAVSIAPCYFVPGNHEAKSNEYDDLKKGLLDAGITILEDDILEITLSDQKINLIGICDPLIKTSSLPGDSKTITDKRLDSLSGDGSKYTVLLSHRPELFDIYVKHGMDLVLSGHAHGGQFRIPFVGGLFSPNQGLFPKYDSGLYTDKNTNMVVSRGIGRSIIPFRINNRPEIILIELKK